MCNERLETSRLNTSFLALVSEISIFPPRPLTELRSLLNCIPFSTCHLSEVSGFFRIGVLKHSGLKLSFGLVAGARYLFTSPEIKTVFRMSLQVKNTITFRERNPELVGLNRC